MFSARRYIPLWVTLRPRGVKRCTAFVFVSLLIGLALFFDAYSLARPSRTTSTTTGTKADADKESLWLKTWLRDKSSGGTAVTLPLHQGQGQAKTKVLTSANRCPGLNISLPVVKSKFFQALDGTDTSVYSAYLDPGRVRVISIRHHRDHQRIYCRLWYDVKTDTNVTDLNASVADALTVTTAVVDDIPEGHNGRYTGSFIFCDLPKDRKEQIPVAVSVSTSRCQSDSSNLLPVQQRLGPMILNFTVCVTPLNNKYDHIQQLVEMIEFNRILGAQKIVFYNYSIGPRAAKVLAFYQQQGLVDVYPWNLPSLEIHYYGQLASLNDCLYQHKNRSRFLVYQDLDEFIVPRDNASTWGELVERRQKSQPKAAIFLVKNVFFRREWPRTWSDFQANGLAKKFQSVVLQTTFREFQVLPYNHRSKYILDPLQTSVVGIHFVWRTFGHLDKVPQEDALVCHYRDWKSPKDQQRRVVDVSVVARYGQKIVASLEKAWGSLERNVGLKPD